MQKTQIIYLQYITTINVYNLRELFNILKNNFIYFEVTFIIVFDWRYQSLQNMFTLYLLQKQTKYALQLQNCPLVAQVDAVKSQ